MIRRKRDFNNQDVVNLLRSVAAAYEIKDEKANKFKIAAYDRAATAIEHLTSEVKDLWDDNRLNTIPGVGGSIAQHLDELFRTGRVKHFDQVMSGLPRGMFGLLGIKGIGAKTAYYLAKELKIKNSENAVRILKKAAKEKKIRTIEGFGPDSEEKIYQSIKEFERVGKKKKRMSLPYADALAEQIVSHLSSQPGIKRIDPLGSLRRRCATVGDIDLAVATNNPREVISHFTKFSQKKRVLESGRRGASLLLKSGCQIDLRVQKPDSYGSLLQHYTGSKHHNIALREYALKKGYSLSEYGIKEIKTKKRNKFATEEEFYSFLGLKWIPPELREDNGEIEAAQTSQLPDLVSLKDIKGDLHLHSNFNIETSHDLGADSMEDLVKKAVKLNYQYLAFAEHNPSQSGHNLNEIISILKEKKDYIDKRRETWKNNFNIIVFNSLEVDIRPDGSLAIPDQAFKYLDFVTVSVHSAFQLSRKKMTRRIIAALSHPKARILGHPTGRKIGLREGYEIDWDQLFDFCLENGKIIEINASPDRLDLPDTLIREAVKRGLKLAINSDAHALDQLELMRYGVSTARRGWAEKKDIVNTLPLEKISPLLAVDNF